MSDQNGPNRPESDQNGLRNEGDRRNDPGRRPDGPTLGRRYLRSIENIVLVAGICAITALFLVNAFIGLAGVAIAALAIMRLRAGENFEGVDPRLVAKARSSARIVLGLCIASVAISLVLDAVLTSMLADYLESAEDVIETVAQQSSTGSSTWG